MSRQEMPDIPEPARPRRRRSLKPIAAVTGAVIAAIAVYANAPGAGPTVAAIEARARDALAANGFTWATVSIEHGIAHITGNAPGEPERLIAYDVVRKALRPQLGGDRLVAELQSHLLLAVATAEHAAIAPIASEPVVEPAPVPTVAVFEPTAAAVPDAPQTMPEPPTEVVAAAPTIEAPSPIVTSAIEPRIAPAVEDCKDEFADLLSETSIVFGNDSAVIADESTAVLDQLATIARHCDGYKMTVEGHTDINGRTEHNRTLSQRRAEAVRTALIARGVANDAIAAKGYGASRPVATGTTDADLAKNRRIAFTVQEAAVKSAQRQLK